MVRGCIKSEKFKMLKAIIFRFKLFVLVLIRIVKIFILKYYGFFFNATVIEQNKNYKKIPIIIINFNQLYYLKKLIFFLENNEYRNIIIIDNNSTYKPLLHYYKLNESNIKLYQMDKNYGHEVFWLRNDLFKQYTKGYYVVTDPDIVPIIDCPEDFLLSFKNKVDNNYKISKVGFSLIINDIPDENKNKIQILNWENQYWQVKNKDGDFIAKIDTTFALYRPYYIYERNDFFFRAIRTNYPYQAKHGGWYVNTSDLTEEQIYYYSNCNSSASWRINLDGKLENKLYNEL